MGVAAAVRGESGSGILVRQNEDGIVEIHTLLGEKRLSTDDWMIFEPFEGSIFNTTNPFYAYLVPRYLPAGARVWIETLAHPVIKQITNDYIEPLKSCEAIWNGVDLDFLLPCIKRLLRITIG